MCSDHFRLKSIVTPKYLDDNTNLIDLQLQFVMSVPHFCIIKLYPTGSCNV